MARQQTNDELEQPGDQTFSSLDGESYIDDYDDSASHTLSETVSRSSERQTDVVPNGYGYTATDSMMIIVNKSPASKVRVGS